MHTYGWKMTGCVTYSSFKTPWLKHFDSIEIDYFCKHKESINGNVLMYKIRFKKFKDFQNI